MTNHTSGSSKPRNGITFLIKSIFSYENLLAFLLALILIALFIATAADAPMWVYQGF